MDEASILDNYPQLSNEDLRAVFLYVIDSMQYQSLFTHVPSRVPFFTVLSDDTIRQKQL